MAKQAKCLQCKGKGYREWGLGWVTTRKLCGSCGGTGRAFDRLARRK